MSEYVALDRVARLPAPGDNMAIAVRRLEAGTGVEHGGVRFRLEHPVLEGHRFAVASIAEGEPLLSWGLPFGHALHPIAPGAYACNAKMLRVLPTREPELALPAEPNFADRPLEPYLLDEAVFQYGAPLPPHAGARAFQGYARSGGRGVGTRNDIVILGVTSRENSYARALEDRLRGAADLYPRVDAIPAVAHTEGGEATPPNNLGLLLRTLAGFAVHPNVGSVLIVGPEDGPLTLRSLRAYMEEHGYPLDHVRHRFLSLADGFDVALEEGEAIVRAWLPEVDGDERTRQPLSALKLALQCGGSDAFSGISGNPLAGWVARELVRSGGFANLAETDELIGAERYILQNVRDLPTARAFLDTVARFQELVERHGSTAEGNPSGGNLYRGLYNISLKSIGAAMKKHPDVRLDGVIPYAERMTEPGYFFMDSPGNDLESIAGQVASGCNLIYFVTGNGSITNFPFVPTIKIVTTSSRYELLSKDMDVNAGAYLDGVPMEELGRDTLDLTLRVASGERSVGERAGHSQTSIWRNWRQTGAVRPEEIAAAPEPDGRPLHTRASAPRKGVAWDALRTEEGVAADQVGLVLPTSLCSGQISRIIANRLNASELAGHAVSRFVALPHTEGCGVSAGTTEATYTRMLLGYLTHPLVRKGLLLEHGCEKTHNDFLRHAMEGRGIDPSRFGWASVQLDGGIDRVVSKAEAWFTDELSGATPRIEERAGLGELRLGLASVGPLSREAAAALGKLTRAVVGSGGTVVAPETATFLVSPAYADAVLGGEPVRTTLGHGQRAEQPGLHVMECPTDHWVETMTGLGATGVEVMLVHTPGRPLQAHRMIPVAQVSSGVDREATGVGLDLVLGGDARGWAEELLELVLGVASREYLPRMHGQGNSDFQLTRGLLGISM